MQRFELPLDNNMQVDRREYVARDLEHRAADIRNRGILEGRVTTSRVYDDTGADTGRTRIGYDLLLDTPAGHTPKPTGDDPGREFDNTPKENTE